MTYKEWEQAHEIKRDNIVQKLSGLPTKEIVDYFSYDNMLKAEPNFCRLYAQKIKCHDRNDLNCFFCGCPYFIYDDNGLAVKDGKIVFSICHINAIKGSEFITENAIHQDCSNCELPHRLPFAYREAKEIIRNME